MMEIKEVKTNSEVEVKTDNRVKESVKMLKGKELIINVIAKIQNDMKKNKAAIYEITEEEMLRGGELDAISTIIDKDDDMDYLAEDDVPDYIIEYIKALDVEEETEVSIYHIDENRPSIMRYNNGSVLYDSPYHSKECLAKEGAFYYDVGEQNRIYILKMEDDGKIYYELYLTYEEIICSENEEDIYVLLRDTEPLCSSIDSDIEDSLKALYDAAKKYCQYSRLSYRTNMVLNELLSK